MGKNDLGKIILFDIDGTLLVSDGAAGRAYNKAFEKMFGVINATKDVSVHGKTDPDITLEISKKKLGRLLSANEIVELDRAYFHYLEKELYDLDHFRVLPGATELCLRLAATPNIYVGVETGNLEEAGWAKLKRAQLDIYFTFGAFGSDSNNRMEIVKIAIGRAIKMHGLNDTDIQVIVIGDSPQDIIAGSNAKAVTIGVLTGVFTGEQLRTHNADYIVEDLFAASDIIFSM